MDFKLRVGRVVSNLPAEYRLPVINAVNYCDGTMDSFRVEMQTMAWDYPDMPIDQILEQIEN